MTLQAYLGSLYVNDFNRFGRTWQVIVQAMANYRDQKDDINRLQVRNKRGTMVPLGAVASVREINGPLVLTRYNMYPAASINGNAVARGQLGQRHPGNGGALQSRASPVDELRVDRDGLPRAAGGQHGDHRLRLLDRDGLPGAGRPVRELGHAAGGHPVGPALHAQRPGRDQCQAPGRQQYQPGYQHLHPDRPGGAGGPGQQELDPDRPVRQADPRPGQADPRGHARSLPAAAAADHHDLDGVHPGRGAPALRPWCRGRDAPVAGSGRLQRHARRDVLRRAADAGLLLRDRYRGRVALLRQPGGAPRRQNPGDPDAVRPLRELFRLASRRVPMAQAKPKSKTEEPELAEHK